MTTRQLYRAWRGNARDRAGALALTALVYGATIALLLIFQSAATIVRKQQAELKAIALPPPAKPPQPVRPKQHSRKPVLHPSTAAKAQVVAPAPPDLPAPAAVAPVVDLPKTSIAEIAETSAATGTSAQNGSGGQRGSANGSGGGATYFEGQWKEPPGYDQLARYLPRKAPPMGWAQIMCRTAANYRVTDCYTLEEAPEGSGFAKTMRDASSTFLVLPPHYKGKDVVGGWVRLRMDFMLAKK